MFNCDKCGLCCMQVGKSPIYAELDRGDGVCLYLNETTMLCTIYEKRPLLCNIDETYHEYFHDKMSLCEYYEFNYEVCKKLKTESSR